MSQTPLIGSLLGAIFSCILVDEYQDTKEIQYSLIASILRNGKGATSAFVVGDPNQAIYGSLGGCAIDPKTFGKWAGVSFKEMQLSKNYRSSARVIEYFGNYNVHATKISAAGKQKNFPSVISFEKQTQRKDLDAEIARLIRYNVEKVGIAPGDVCVVAPQWLHLASMTRRLVNLMPEYSFDGPGMVPFARDYDNFWYKVSKVVLTEASPHMYVRRLRWAKDILSSLDAIGIDTEEFSPKVLLRICNSISIVEEDGLTFLGQAFDFLLGEMGIELKRVQMLSDHHKSFFDSSRDRVARLKNEGTECVGELKNFRKAFENRNGVTISTIHGVKGAEYDAVIAFSLLEGMVPHFSDPDRDQSAKRLLYVICSRARKNVHLISELGRLDGRKNEYTATCVLDRCRFKYDKV